MATQFTLTDIPPSDVGEVVADFEGEGCSVEKTKQPDGRFTVRATCPIESAVQEEGRVASSLSNSLDEAKR